MLLEGVDHAFRRLRDRPFRMLTSRSFTLLPTTEGPISISARSLARVCQPRAAPSSLGDLLYHAEVCIGPIGRIGLNKQVYVLMFIYLRPMIKQVVQCPLYMGTGGRL